jgi:hypothetical protein
MKMSLIFISTTVLIFAQFSLAKVVDCTISNTASQVASEVQIQIAKKYSVVNTFASYEFALPFQLSSSENLKPLPGEDQITYRKRLIATRKLGVSSANNIFVQFLNQSRLSHVYVPGPQNLAIWTVKAKISELEYILKASDNCDIYKIASVLVN